jgi:virginiamycin B lyase
MNVVRFVCLSSAMIFAAAFAGCGSSGAPSPSVMPAGVAWPASSDRHVTISEFTDLPQDDHSYFPTALTVGPDGAIWVADDIDQDIGQSAIVRITPSGKRTNTYYFQNETSPSFEGIATGSDGALWLTDWGDGIIVRCTTQGAITTFPVYGHGPYGITAGPDKALWFAAGNAIGRITTQGVISFYTKGLAQGSGVPGITSGPDGALWFTDQSHDAVGRITVAGKITEFSKGMSSDAEPYSIAAGPDGALWFTEVAGRIGRVTTTGKITEYSRGISESEEPSGIAAGPDGALWFTEYESYDSYLYRGSKIGRITTAGKITEYAKNLAPKSQPTGITAGPDGNMWFVESTANKMGRVNL